MKRFFQLLNQKHGQGDLIVVKGIKGQFAKEKMLICNHEVIYQTCDFKEYQDVLRIMNRTQLYSQGDDVFFVEKVGGRQTLVICGAGHVSLSIIALAKMLGFYIIVLEDRQEYASLAKKAGADEVVVSDFKTAMAQIVGSDDTYFVIVTRGHGYDKVCLKEAIHKKHAYIGMMGSQHRVAFILKQLKDEGENCNLLDLVHTPIGLKINAQTPQEIAVSIMAEIILNKNAEGSTTIYDDDLLQGLTTLNQEAVLATIIKKHGSTPRDIGVMMLVKKDGTCIGTIGGGLAENQIKEAALRLLDSFEDHCCMVVNMCSQGISLEGMVCGGTIEVYLEKMS